MSRPSGRRAGRLARALVPLVGVAAASCASAPAEPDLPAIYDRIARAGVDERNPVVVIPGLLGSNLIDAASGERVWGGFVGQFADPDTASGARAMALPMDPNLPLDRLLDGVVADGALETVEVSLLGIPIELSAYVDILRALGVGGYLDQQLSVAAGIDYGEDHYSCFQFAYDWRRDIPENAARLHRFLTEEVVPTVAAQRGDADVRVDVVAHSMGALLLRYYLRYGDAQPDADGAAPLDWKGAELVERAVLVGPPNAGSMHALRGLVDGTDPGPLTPFYPPAVVGTYPSLYQLLPRARHGGLREAETNMALDPLDAELWDQRGWGLLDPRQDRVLRRLMPDVEDADRRRAIAADHLAKCLDRARVFQTLMDVSAQPPPGTTLMLVAGDAAGTLAGIAVDGRGRLEDVEWLPGDGTVTRASSLLDERAGESWGPRLVTPVDWDRVLFVFSDHFELTRSPVFTDNVLYELLEAPRR